MKEKHTYSGSIVLGTHDALVSLTGLIAGLTFTFTNRISIILSAIIASVAAGLSMAASSYLAEKTTNKNNAILAGFFTGIAYLVTCILLIAPYIFVSNTEKAFFITIIIAVLIILMCNYCISWMTNRPFWKNTIEMLVICATVSILAFLIGKTTKFFIQ